MASTLRSGRAAAQCRPAFRQRGRQALRVVNFRDEHRAKQLVDTASEFSRAWAKGHVSGPSVDVMKRIEQLAENNIKVKAAHPLGSSSFQGIDGIRVKFDRSFKAHPERAGAAATKEAEVILAAANDATDTAFVLVKLPEPDYPAGTPPFASETGYMLLKMDILLDDGMRRVTNVVERGQLLSGAIDSKHGIAAIDKLQSATRRTRPEFPKELIKKWAHKGEQAVNEEHPEWRLANNDKVQKVEKVLNAWTKAGDSATDVLTQLNEAGVDEEFKMFDAYGYLPLLLPLPAGGRPAIEPTYSPAAATGSAAGEQPSINTKKSTMGILEATKGRYEVNARLADWAVALDEAAAFSHWTIKQHNRQTGKDWEVEGTEVDILDPQTGALKAVYLFRDCFDFEELQLVGAAFGPAELEKEMKKVSGPGGSEVHASQTGSTAGYQTQHTADRVGDKASNVADKVKHGLKEAGQNIKETVSETRDNIKDTYKDVKHEAKDTYRDAKHEAKDNYRDAMHEAKDTYRDAKHQAKDSAHSAQHQAKDSAHSAQLAAAQKADQAANKAQQSAHRAEHSASSRAEHSSSSSSSSTINDLKTSTSNTTSEVCDPPKVFNPETAPVANKDVTVIRDTGKTRIYEPVEVQTTIVQHEIERVTPILHQEIHQTRLHEVTHHKVDAPVDKGITEVVQHGDADPCGNPVTPENLDQVRGSSSATADIQAAAQNAKAAARNQQ